MKKLILSYLVLVLGASILNGQTVFSVKPGFNLNAASIGIAKSNFQPSFGLRFANLNLKYEFEDENFPEDNYKTTTRINVYMPHIGAKLFFSGTESVKPYVQATLFKPLVFGKQLEDGDENENFKESLNNLKIWAGEVGFGSEYFFHPQFSLGGEFGVRLANLKEKFESEDYTLTSKAGVSISYVCFSLNYYFNAKDNS
jgi:hypothetical protein